MANPDEDFEKEMKRFLAQTAAAIPRIFTNAITVLQVPPGAMPGGPRKRKPGSFTFELGEPDADGWMARTMWVWR